MQVRSPLRARRGQRGQALVETVIVMPIMVFAVLGALQLMLVQHGRILTEYASYCAARAGVVHSADWNVMRNAALLASLPLYDRTDGPARFLATWAKVKAAAEMSEAVDTGSATLERLAGDLLGVELPGIAQDISLVEVAVTNPTEENFRDAQRWATAQSEAAASADGRALAYPDDEIDFDDVEMMSAPSIASGQGLGRLALEVRVLFPLKIPVVNKILFELWLAQELLRTRTLNSNLQDWVRFEARITSGGGTGQTLSDAVRSGDDSGPLDGFLTTSQWIKEVRTLRYVAENYGVYLLPLRSSYVMQMQSNLFETNRREPVWFSLDDF